MYLSNTAESLQAPKTNPSASLASSSGCFSHSATNLENIACNMLIVQMNFPR